MRIGFLTACFLTSLLVANAQQNYDVNLIPRELLSYASSVIRNSEMNIEVEGLDNVTEHVNVAITVLNENGNENALLYLDYDKSKAIRFVKGSVYNAFGKQISKFSSADFIEQNEWDGFSLFNGTRIKYYRPSETEYPYTIVYEYETRSRQSLGLPDWDPVPHFGEAVEKSSYKIICRQDFPIKYKENKIPDKAVISVGRDGKKTYSWQVNYLKAVKHEPYSPYPEDFFPGVQVAPQRFAFYGLTGSFNSWKELGKWDYDNLIASRQDLPVETIEKIRDLTKDITDPKLKAKKIYEYMQRKTHYISVQVGIGGWQPFLASDVDQQNYGDCKALVNYTQALLKAVNINSYYCVVTAGRGFKVSMPTDFPSMRGNHIILCIPFKNDTTWADCTSQSIPFGYLGDFTDDRTVLACTPEGGKLMHTPKYAVNDNVESRKASFVIDADGGISGNMITLLKGVNYEDREELVNESTTEQNKILQKIYPINNLEIEHYDLKQDKSFDPSTTESVKLHAKDYASFAGGKYFFMLNPVNRVTEPPRQVTNRRNDVYINRGYTDADEISYTIPPGYRLEKTPLNISIDKPFGKFTATMDMRGDQLIYKRKFQLIDGTYSKDTYADLVDFFQDVVDADAYTVSLVKN